MKIIKSFYFYGVAFVISGITPFLLIPLLTKKLSPEEFGAAALFLIWTPLISSVLGLGSHGYVSVRYFKVDKENFRSLLKTSAIMIGVGHLVAILVVVFSYSILKNIFNMSYVYLLLSVFASFLLCINLQNLTVFQISGRSTYYLVLKLVQALFEIGLCVGFLYLNYVGSESRIFTYVIALGVSMVLGFVYCKKLDLFGGSFSKNVIVHLFEFFLPIMPHIVAGAFLGSMDRLIVSTKLGNDSLGIYMTAVQVGMVLIIVIDPLNKVLAPWLFSQLSKDDERIRRQIVMRTYQLYGLIAFMGIIFSGFCGYIFDYIIDSRYQSAKVLIPWIVGGFVMQGFYYTQVNYLFYAERTGRLSVATCSAALLGGGISLFLTESYGLMGAAESFFIVNFLLFVFVWFASANSVRMPWRLGG